MLKFESCDAASMLRFAQWRETAAALPGEANDGSSSSKEAAQGFASVLYAQLFREMQQTIPQQDEEEGEEDMGGIESAQDFLGMYLPTALSAQGTDPLSRSIEAYMRTPQGEPTNERD